MKSKMKLLTTVIVTSLVGFLGAAVPATADTEASVQTEAMYGVPVTETNAISFGYEVRTDQAGVRYAVHPGTAEGDFSRAVPIVDETPVGSVSPQTTAYGDCGYSWVYFTSRSSYRTGYQIYKTFGNTINFSWSTTFSSSIDALSIPDGSLFASQRWEVSRAHPAQALPGAKLSATAGGSVLTSGGICFSLGPYDSITW